MNKEEDVKKYGYAKSDTSSCDKTEWWRQEVDHEVRLNYILRIAT